MKHYNRRFLTIHTEEMKRKGATNEIPKRYFAMVEKVAKKVPKDYARIGVMDLNDIIQEANMALIVAWNNIKWDIINKVPKKEREDAIHGFLFKSMTLQVKRRVQSQSDGMRVPQMGAATGESRTDKYGNIKGIQSAKGKDILTTLFPNWFKDFESVIDHWGEDVDDYASEQLGFFIEELLYRDFKYSDADIILWFYGIGHDRLSYKEIAERQGKRPKAINVKKHRLMESLKSNHYKNLISKYVVEEEFKTSSNAYAWCNENLNIY